MPARADLGFEKILTWTVGIAGVLSVASSTSPLTSALRPAITAFGVFAVLAAGFLLASGKTAARIAGYFDAKATAATQTLEEAKEALAQSLLKRTAPIVVVLDDVDRLTQAQTALLFQLVKANADLPNFVYLMLFQRDIVEESLNSISNDCGAEFLEKIVQVGLDIPRIENSHVEAVLFEGLNALLKDVSESQFDQVRWGTPTSEAYVSTLKRCGREEISSVPVVLHIPRQARRGFEVDAIDFLTIEASVFSRPAFTLRSGNRRTFLPAQVDRGSSDTSQVQVHRKSVV